MTQSIKSSNPSAGPPTTALQHASASLIPNRRVPAWLLSCLLHTFIFLGLLLALSQIPNGASEVENRSGGIVLVNATSDSTEYLSEGDVEESNPQSTSSDSPPPLATDQELPPNLPGLESSPTKIAGAGESLVESLPGADSLIDGQRTRGKIGGQVTTEIFGVKGTGSRFVYVIDRSESMAGFAGRPILAARQQLLASLDSLKHTNQFQIIFYNQDVRLFNPDGRAAIYFATDEIKEKAIGFANRTRPEGGTDHVNALKQAFRFAPDVIFLLTDAEGGFTQRELRELGNYNRSGAIINTIEFGQRPGRDQSLATVSRNSGGQYIFKNINTLRVENK